MDENSLQQSKFHQKIDFIHSRGNQSTENNSEVTRKLSRNSAIKCQKRNVVNANNRPSRSKRIQQMIYNREEHTEQS